MATPGEFARFWRGVLRHITVGSREYYIWVAILVGLIVWGGFGYWRQVELGLIGTAMRDPVMWGFYIGNFTFLVGVAAAAVVLVIPAYVYQWGPIKEIVIIGELLAISAIIMCMGFVIVDVGRPDRLWHLLPMVGSMNFPQSLLAWDIIVLNFYLLINAVVVVHILYRSFYKRPWSKTFVVPLVLLSIPMAVSIHTVTAFLYSGLPARPFWNTSILAPRFLASAFCSGPAIILIALQILKKTAGLKIRDEALWKIGELMAYAIGINLFFLLAEVFNVYYSDTHELAHFEFLYFGLESGAGLAGYAWVSTVATIISFVLFTVPATRKNFLTLNIGCVLVYLGVYIEKGVGLVIPGLTPGTLGEVYAYKPTMLELQIAAGIFGLGFLVFTFLVRTAIPIAIEGAVAETAPRVADHAASENVHPLQTEA